MLVNFSLDFCDLRLSVVLFGCVRRGNVSVLRSWAAGELTFFSFSRGVRASWRERETRVSLLSRDFLTREDRTETGPECLYRQRLS